MKQFALSLIVFSLTGCGSFVYGPDFKGASAICDRRYGVGTPASDACFEDYLHFNTITVSVDLSSISDFCKTAYTAPVDQQACAADLIQIVTNIKH